MADLNPAVEKTIATIRKRSRTTRANYLERILRMENDPDSNRGMIGCSNLAHAAAGALEDQAELLSGRKPHIGIITAYNDMLSAHQPYEQFPQILKAAIRQAGGTAQVAAGVPAMCDGVTQGRPGMELSLASRDVIALATAVGLSHGVFDAALCLGICDKIVPGLVIGALSHGHIPVIMVPAGPMSSGLPNAEKAARRKAFARGEIGRKELLQAEASSYHGPGTCTFYGTANSNQMLMEVMGLHLPGAAFEHPHSDLRHALNIETGMRSVAISRRGASPRPIGRMLDERSFVNAIVGLHATGGSTNHTLHLPAMAAAAGIDLRWDDFAALSDVVPLLTRIYPNGNADVNHFHAAGGMGYVMAELLAAGLIDGSALTVWGDCLADYAVEPKLGESGVIFTPAPKTSLDHDILRPVANPHHPNGGLAMLSGNLGRAVIKISAVDPAHHRITAPAAVFDHETEVKAAFAEGRLNRDLAVVVRNQGPQANGMPELHSLTPILGNLQDQGHAVMLITDGRMSGASGRVPAAIHVTPEAINGGAIGRIRDGDVITLDANTGTLEVAADLSRRPDANANAFEGGFGRELFADMREKAASAEAGGGINLLRRYK
ncbi:phosphogluconate dehydratase [Alphaproteobacteria bacterium LSUCC0684]